MWTTLPDCTIHLNPEVWSSLEVDDLNFSDFCQAMVHEVGHLLGHTDAAGAPGTVTQREALRAPIVPECRHYRLRFGHEWISR
jgi:hypothetical protein